jgi:hypothetical protein
MPWKHFIVEELYNANLPLWNPYHVNGFPQHGDSMTWYPISWIFGFLNGSYNLNALNYEYIFHVFIAGLGFYTFSNKFVKSHKIRFLLGLSYMFSGFMLGNAQHISWIISAAWMPWVFHYLNILFEENKFRTILKFTLTSFFLFSGGYLAIFFVVIYLLFAFIIYKVIKLNTWKERRKISLKLILGLVLIFLLSLPLLHAAIEIFPLFNRSSSNLQDSIFNISVGATPWNGILAIILPFSSGIYNINEIEFGTFSSYLGTIPILIIVLNPKILIQNKKLVLLFLLALFFLLCSMGDTFPFRKLISHLPLLDLFRYPTLFRLFFIFFILLVSGIILEKIKIKQSITKKHIQIILLSFILIFSVGALSISSKINIDQIQFALKYIFKQNFLSDFDLSSRIFVNLIIFSVLSIAIFLYVTFKKEVNIFKILFLFWGIELLFVAFTSAPQSVFHPVNVEFTNKKIDYQAKNYPQIDLKHQENEQNAWRDYLDFSWQGKTFYLKQFSQNWYNPLKLSNQSKSKFRISEAEISKLPLFSIVAFDENKRFKEVKYSNLKLKFSDNQNFTCTNIINSEKNCFLLFKQNYVPEWEIKNNSSQIEPILLENGFMLIPLINSKEIHFNYKNKTYTFVFWISTLSLLFFLILLFVTSKNKTILATITIILSSIFLLNSLERIQKPKPLEKNEIAKMSLLDLDKTDQFYYTSYWKGLKSRLLIPQNKAKSDAEISFIEYFYPNKIDNIKFKNKIYSIHKKTEEKRKVILKRINLLGNNNFKINLRDYYSKHKVIGFKMIFEADTLTKNTLWISHNRNGKWINGKSWDIENQQPKNQGKEKLIIHYLDLSQYDLKINDELNLYLWSEDKNSEFKISVFEIFETKY